MLSIQEIIEAIQRLGMLMEDKPVISQITQMHPPRPPYWTAETGAMRITFTEVEKGVYLTEVWLKSNRKINLKAGGLN